MNVYYKYISLPAGELLGYGSVHSFQWGEACLDTLYLMLKPFSYIFWSEVLPGCHHFSHHTVARKPLFQPYWWFACLRTAVQRERLSLEAEDSFESTSTLNFSRFKDTGCSITSPKGMHKRQYISYFLLDSCAICSYIQFFPFSSSFMADWRLHKNIRQTLISVMK